MLQDPGHPADVFDCMDAYAAATSRGREIYGQVTPFPEIMDFNLREPYPLESLASWQPAMAASGDEDLMAVFRDLSGPLYTSPSPRDATLSRMPSPA